MNYYCYNNYYYYYQSGGEGTFSPLPSPHHNQKEERKKKNGIGEIDEKDRELRVVGGRGVCFFCAAAHVISS